jgi:hypothetical protein
MSTELLNPKDGKHLNQIFCPIKINPSSSGLSASTARGSLVVDGLMRNATVKANGDDIVEALNLSHALGWAVSRNSLRIGEAIRDLFCEHFEVTSRAAEIGATRLCDRLGVATNHLLSEDPDVFLLIAREYLRHPLGFIDDLYSGMLLGK